MKKLNVKLIKKEILRGNGVTVIVKITEHISCNCCGLKYTEVYVKEQIVTSLFELNSMEYEEEFVDNKLTLVSEKEIFTNSKCVICEYTN